MTRNDSRLTVCVLVRPILREEWAQSVCNLIQACWSSNPSERLKFDDISAELLFLDLEN